MLQVQPLERGEDGGYKVFFESIDVLIIGRNTYEKILSFSNWLYGTKQVIVLSRSNIIIPQQLVNTVSYSAEIQQNYVNS